MNHIQCACMFHLTAGNFCHLALFCYKKITFIYTKLHAVVYKINVLKDSSPPSEYGVDYGLCFYKK